MASIRQRNGRWQARVIRQGYPEQTQTFESKAAAERWARSVEASIDRGQFVDFTEAHRTTLGDLIERYLREVTPTMKSATDDTIRLRAIMRRPIAKWGVANLSAARVAAFRDERLQQVSSGTVIRELACLSAIINHARREWGIEVDNPVCRVRKPPSPPGRERVLTDAEQDRLLNSLQPTGRRNPWMLPLVALALETAMRRGELLGLRWADISLEKRTATLRETKNGEGRVGAPIHQ